MARRQGRLLALIVAGVFCLGVNLCFVPSPQAAKAELQINPHAVGAAAMPMLMWASEAGAEEVNGLNPVERQMRWSSFLVPLTTLVIPAIGFYQFVIYLASPDAFHWAWPGHPRAKQIRDAWKSHPYFKDHLDPMKGFVNYDDYEQGLHEAWEAAKPAGSTVTVKDKLKELSTQNNPHFQPWEKKGAITSA
eukprot:TRINITY_DN1686_c0_g1_i4.p1 TRINITY_DN1686_c0_g1~~TRINITY_DN1686_c0_g1_i4.p1  ORF type:complete len:191 (-),score=44.59 TRINITY_DN1686_c0_g1_i4:325-897(-)